MLHSNCRWSTEQLARYHTHMYTWMFLKRSLVILSHSSDACPSLFQIQRLPFLQSSNLALETLKGGDESIGFEDILNGEELACPSPRLHLKKRVFLVASLPVDRCLLMCGVTTPVTSALTL